MGLFDSLFGPSPAQRAAREAEEKKRQAERAKQAAERAAAEAAAREEAAWSRLERKYKNQEKISATAKEVVKRYHHEQELVFEIEGFKAYMPISKISTGYVSDIKGYVGKSLSFRIVSLQVGEKTCTVDAQIIQREEEQKRRDEARRKAEEERALYLKELARLASRDYVEATVTGIQDRGITVSLIEKCCGRQVDGWIHLSQLSDHFVNHPSEVVKQGDVVKACATVKPSGDELELSMRQYIERENERRKEEVFSRVEEGAIVSGTVKNIKGKTVFVDLGGVDATIFISELSRGYVSNPNEVVRVGDEIQAIVLRMDRENGRIELSVKQFLVQQQNERNAQIQASDSYQKVDNRSLVFEGPLCLRLNSNRDPIEERLNNLDESLDSLRKQFPNIAEIETEDVLETILRSTFPDGIKSRMFLRNLTFEGAGGNDNKVLAIRPELSPGCYLSSLLKPGCSLIFKGRVRGKEFVIDSVYETSDTEQLEYEASCTATVFRDPTKVTNNFLYDALVQVASITKHTSACLDEWEAYLQWKRTVAQQQIAGCKYYDVSFDQEKGCFVFELACASKEYFQSFRKYLRSRDILAFGDNYSSDEWSFEFNENGDRKGRRARGIELGKFDGVLEQGYLDDLPDGYYVPLTPEDERSLRSAFASPYMARVSYELSEDDADDISEQELEPEEEIAYIRENLLSKYHNKGFLALSAAGQFTLISRFDRAIGDLRNDQSKSPNLALWLFDATRARLPRSEMSTSVDEWLNPGIASNSNQCAAVQKMLDAPDLCLVQGPPGTGKTTVIAEAIYQMAKRGNRVLIASQSNDAVDNALDRLAETPQIRAIRLGQKSRQKKHLDGYEPHKYSEDETLKSYYSSLSSSLSESWLDGWDAIDAKVDEFEADIRSARFFREDIAELRKRRSGYLGDLEALRSEKERNDKLFDSAQEKSDALVHERRQIGQLKRIVSGESSEGLYLTARQLDVVMSQMSAHLNDAFTAGLLVIPSYVDTGAQSERAQNASIEIAASAVSVLRGLPEKLRIAENSTVSDDVQILERKKKDIQAQMLAALDEDDDDAVMKWREQLKAVKLEIDQASSGANCVSLDSSEKRLLDSALLERIDSGSATEVAEIISRFLSVWDAELPEIFAALGRLEEAETDESEAILENIKVLRGKIESKESKLSDVEEEIRQKSATLSTLSSKYSVGSQDADEIIAAIENARAANENLIESQRPFRRTWESVIRGFKSRLDSSEIADYDDDYFKRIYINACNVVGISCTDNMRNLDERGFDAFDVVIIDEVSKATPPELLIPLMKARKAILVGDHRQLPPMFDEHEKSYSELISDPESIPEDVRQLMTGENFARFQRMVTSSLFKEYFENADESIKHSLLVQYRMHSDIMDIINRFYDGRLMAGMTSDQENISKSHGLQIRGIDGGSFITLDRHAYWIDSSSLPDGTPIYESFPGKSTSACNYLEIAAIIELLKRMAKEYAKQGYGKGNKKSVGVISFYQSQVNELRRRFKSAKKTFDFSALDVDINTVDRFQGKEKNIIIASLVRNNAHARASKHVVAFERINVAFSRAQEMLVIIGAKHMYEGLNVELPDMDTGEIKKIPVYRYILEDLSLRGCLRSTNQLVDDAAAAQVLSDFEKNRRKNEAR